jgi:acetyltransferase-like isoleucine patch superfamily enzyme
MTARWLEACDAVGAEPLLDARPTIENRGRIEIGDRFRLASRPVTSHMVSGPEGALVVGDDVAIAHGAGIATFARVEIGHGTRIGPFVIIMDTDFHVIGDRSERHEASPIRIGRDVRIGTRVTILRGAMIGDGAVVEAGSVVSGDVPNGARVAGVPARLASGPRDATEPDDDVPLVVMRTLGLSEPPPLGYGPRQIAQWDSLGALKLLLALEETFSVMLAEDEVARVASVGDLAAVVARARARSVPHEPTL